MLTVQDGGSKRLEAHATPWSSTFYPDGSRFVTCNWDSTLSLWDPVRGEIFSFKSHDRTYPVRAAFSPDGTRLVDAASDGGHQVWDISSIQSRAAARRVAARDRLIEKQVAPLVDELLAELILPRKVVTRLAVRAGLEADERRVATRLARNHCFIRGDVIFEVWKMLSDPGLSPDAYLRALEAAELGLRLAGDRQSSFNAVYLTAMGAAQYRMGRYDEALASLTAAREIRAPTAEKFGVWGDTLFEAMALVRLGRRSEAEELLERNRISFALRDDLNEFGQEHMNLSLALLQEAEELLAR
jgi:tetratricopeptide (TPR) repeat protein